MKILSKLLLVLVAVLTSISSWAQVSFTVDAPSPVEVGERFSVTFVVNAEPDRGSFVSPSFEGFNVIAGPATSIGQSVQFINGSQTSSYTCTYTYTLKAQTAGTFNIGKASVSVGGKAYTTKILPIEVIEGTQDEQTATSRRNADGLILRWVLTDNEVYKGEAVRASLMLYYNVDLYNIQNFQMGTFENFWSQDLKIPDPMSRAEYNGRVYNTYKIAEYLLVPQSCGDQLLPEVQLDAIVMVIVEGSPYDIFYGRQREQEVFNLKTKPTTIKVKEFPEGAPASFKGAVGNFTMTCKVPEESINRNSADEVVVTIKGSGNLNFMTAPHFSLSNSFELYDTKIDENIQNTNRGAMGQITYTYPFVARAAGDFDVAGIEFSYFDPSKERYETLSSGDFTLSVVDDGSSSSYGSGSSSGISAGYGDTKVLDEDIRYIKSVKLRTKSRSMLLASSIYWIILLSLIAAFVAIFIIMHKRIRNNSNIVMRRMKRADKVAIQRLRMAHKSMKEGNRHAFYEEILRAMWGYISDKFNIPVSNLTKETIREELSHRGVSSNDSEQFCHIISRADEAQYAPMADDDMNMVYMDAIDVISKIESVVKGNTIK